MSKKQSKIFSLIGAKKYWWCVDHSDVVKSVIGFIALLTIPAIVVAIAELVL